MRRSIASRMGVSAVGLFIRVILLQDRLGKARKRRFRTEVWTELWREGAPHVSPGRRDTGAARSPRPRGPMRGAFVGGGARGWGFRTAPSFLPCLAADEADMVNASLHWTSRCPKPTILAS